MTEPVLYPIFLAGARSLCLSVYLSHGRLYSYFIVNFVMFCFPNNSVNTICQFLWLCHVFPYNSEWACRHKENKADCNMKKLELPHDSMTSPRYIDAQRKINEMKPLKERTANVSICVFIIRIILIQYQGRKRNYWNCRSDHITPHTTPLQGQGQISANFSASLEWTLRDIKSS